MHDYHVLSLMFSANVVIMDFCMYVGVHVFFPNSGTMKGSSGGQRYGSDSPLPGKVRFGARSGPKPIINIWSY